MFFELSIVKSPKELNELAKREGFHPISYSQFSLFIECPFAWKTKYIDNIKDESYSIHLLFGSAMHTVLQEYLTTFYKEGGKEADEIDFNKRLLEEMTKEYIKATANMPIHLQDFTSQKEMIDFYRQGLEILYFIRKNRGDYFTKKGWELVGVEVPILATIDANPDICLIGFIDVILKDIENKRYKIIDFKTSSLGWKDNDKANLLKNAQLILYKKYYAKQLGIEPKHIDVEFLILRRIIFKGKDGFPMKHIQRHVPASGTVTMKKVEKFFNEFVKIFDKNGQIKEDVKFPKNVSKACKSCFYGEHNICDKKL